MKQCIVTGASGYIGSQLVKYLLAQGTKVNVILRPHSSTSSLPTEHDALTNFVYDGSFESIKKILIETKPDCVFHMAAHCSFKDEASEIEKLIDANIKFGAHLLQAMAETGCHQLINTGSYSQQNKPDEFAATCLYAVTKQCFEHMIDYYVSSYKLQAITLRLMDVYGPNDQRPKLLQLLKNAADSDETLSTSPGLQLRDFIHVDDVCSAYFHAFQRLQNNNHFAHDVFYVATNRLVTLRELAGLVSKTLSKPIKLDWGKLPYRNNEIMQPYIGRLLPNWKANITLEEGLLSLFTTEVTCQ